MTPEQRQRIQATIDRASAGLRVFAPMPAKPVSLPKPLPERQMEQSQ